MSDKIHQLQQQFPDISQSMLGDILTTYQQDTKKAAEVLRSIDEDTKREQQKKINELKELFPGLPERAISQCLEEAKGDVDAAIVVCFNKVEEVKQVCLAVNVTPQPPSGAVAVVCKSFASLYSVYLHRSARWSDLLFLAREKRTNRETQKEEGRGRTKETRRRSQKEVGTVDRHLPHNSKGKNSGTGMC
jgi:hypothetical protein